jgi:3-hydroxyacyl-[acyl-carrier-protein] dehydratase
MLRVSQRRARTRWFRNDFASAVGFAVVAMIKSHGMTFEVHRRIRAEHPSLPGHFPNAPVVPGVVILDEVLTALAEWRDDCQLAAIRAVKFLVPLKPEQPFTVHLSAGTKTESEVDFCCSVEGRIIVEGRLQLHC